MPLACTWCRHSSVGPRPLGAWPAREGPAAALTCVTAVLLWGTDAMEAPPDGRKGPLTCGGAKGTRTPNPLLAKQVRYQLRHGPVNTEPARTRRAGGIRCRWKSAVRRVGGLRPEPVLGLLGLDLLLHRDDTDGRRDEDEELLQPHHHLAGRDRGGGPNRT